MNRPLLTVMLALLFVANSCGEPPAAEPTKPPETAPSPQVPEAATEAAVVPETEVISPFVGLWKIRMERQLWWPRAVHGTIAVHDTADGPTGTLTFVEMWGQRAIPIRFEQTEPSEFSFWIEHGEDLRVLVVGSLTGEQHELLTARCIWTGGEQTDESVIHGERVASLRRFEPHTESDVFEREPDPAAVGVDPGALDRLIWIAEERDTDALVVIKDGRLLCHRTFLRPPGNCTLQSITKVVSSLAIPLLMEDGKLPRDLDTPISKWYPEFAQDPGKAKITLRHILTHTSGLASDGTQAMQGQKDYLAYARASPLVHEPGSHAAYSNQAMQLLSGIFRQASGEQVDTYLQRRIGTPLGMTSWTWIRDGAANPPTYVGLECTALDLALFGQLIVQRGAWNGKRLVPEAWFDDMVVPSPTDTSRGLAWRLSRDEDEEIVTQTQAGLDRLRASGFGRSGDLQSLVGQTFAGRDVWWKTVREKLGQAGAQALHQSHLRYPAVAGTISGPVSCVYHTGSMGQYLLIYPKDRLVVVRQRRGFAADELSDEEKQFAGFPELRKLASALVK